MFLFTFVAEPTPKSAKILCKVFFFQFQIRLLPAAMNMLDESVENCGRLPRKEVFQNCWRQQCPLGEIGLDKLDEWRKCQWPLCGPKYHFHWWQ